MCRICIEVVMQKLHFFILSIRNGKNASFLSLRKKLLKTRRSTDSSSIYYFDACPPKAQLHQKKKQPVAIIFSPKNWRFFSICHDHICCEMRKIHRNMYTKFHLIKKSVSLIKSFRFPAILGHFDNLGAIFHWWYFQRLIELTWGNVWSLH